MHHSVDDKILGPFFTELRFVFHLSTSPISDIYDYFILRVESASIDPLKRG